MHYLSTKAIKNALKAFVQQYKKIWNVILNSNKDMI